MYDEPLTPITVEQSRQMDFPSALSEVINGKKITRLSWEPKQNSYGLLKDGFLMIFIMGEFHKWIINDVDLQATDWITLEDSN